MRRTGVQAELVASVLVHGRCGARCQYGCLGSGYVLFAGRSFGSRRSGRCCREFGDRCREDGAAAGPELEAVAPELRPGRP